MKITGWGRHPVVETERYSPRTASDLKKHLDAGFRGIARGLGRSYGDCSLAPRTISSRYLNQLLSFDKTGGLVRCSSGTPLADLLAVFVPKGWFLPVTPGTKFVSVGGAIASDVHGKNHHCEGSFCDHVREITLLMGDGQVVTCSRELNPGLFQATCGGMGLTGIILEAEIRLKPIQSASITETVFKAANLEELLELFEQHDKATYSVAWIDCLAGGKNLGRSLLMLGEHADRDGLEIPRQKTLGVPMEMPGWLLNRYSVAAFNFLYYRRAGKIRAAHTTHYEPFFYPLDRVHNWNRIYGKNGFTQYQFVIPKPAGREGTAIILQKIAASQRSSFLAVLKTLGPGNDSLLGFPMEGYTLALDLKLDKGLFGLLAELDRMVLDFEGRLYLTKDASMSPDTFRKSYPRWEEFVKIRRHWGADRIFNSLQSQRLGI